MPRNDTSDADHPAVDHPGAFSRRHVLTATASAGVASVAGAALLPATADATEPAHTRQAQPGSVSGEPVVAHVPNASSGQVVLFQGTRRVEVHDPHLAALLLRAATHD